MNRPIKFRAYHKEYESLFEIVRFDKIENELVVRNPKYNNKLERWKDNENVVWSQFTGLTDKEGNEIYEGDIIEHDWGLEVVEFGYDTIDEKEQECFWCGFQLSEPPEKAKVIGNKFEDKELLNK